MESKSPGGTRLMLAIVGAGLGVAAAADRVLMFVGTSSLAQGRQGRAWFDHYHAQRDTFFRWLPVLVPVALALLAAIWVALQRSSVLWHRFRAWVAGVLPGGHSDKLPRVGFSLQEEMERNPKPKEQLVLGQDEHGRTIYVTDRERSTHVHVVGQTGSGKTKSVLEPLVLQDLKRGRGVAFIDAKGSQENEERFLAMAKACGRYGHTRVFTLNPCRYSHTYNPIHIGPSGDPQAIAERIFSSFAEDMNNPYYRNQASTLLVRLVKLLAATGKPIVMRDISACIASREILHHAMTLSSDAQAKAEIAAQYRELGKEAGKAFTGLQAAVDRYHHPLLNDYAPSIILPELIAAGHPFAFFLPVNAYKLLSRYIGLSVFQELQQVGALRQLDRSRPQTPVAVHADEFYSFAYEGMTDAVNKLRDANIFFQLYHQSPSDLEKVSKEFADGIADNTRYKIIFQQTQADFAEAIAQSLGTQKAIKRTFRETTDGFGSMYSTLEASSREVDEYRLHPNRIKALGCGQAYMIHDGRFSGVNFQTIPDSFFAKYPKLQPVELPKKKVEGLELYKLFVELGGGRDSAGTSRVG